MRTDSPYRRAVARLAPIALVPLLAAALLAAGTDAGPGPAPRGSVAVAVDRPVAAADTVAPTSSAHPFSMPIWYPIHDETYLDCVLSNPGCGTTHPHWTMDMVLETLRGDAPSDPGVYAMGAGVMHIQVAQGRTCTEGGVNDFGTTVWIDHGGGVVSRYGHLSRILYPDGTLLAAGQEFALMGTTGKDTNCTVPYLDFQVRTGGVGGPTTQLETLRFCSSATTSGTWPTDLDATQHVRPKPEFPSLVKRTYTSFNQVPQRTVDFPATTGDCIPGTVPATPGTPTGVHLAPAGRGTLSVSWTRPPTSPATTSVQVQLSEFHPSTGTWDYPQNEEYRAVPVSATSYTFTGLVSGHSYRATVLYRNSVGFGPAVVTGAVRSVGAPTAPGARTASVTQASRTASLHFGWTRPTEYGLAVTGFQVQVRRLYTHSASAWSTTSLTREHISWYRPGVAKHARYQMRVRAVYPGGVTGFLTRTVST